MARKPKPPTPPPRRTRGTGSITKLRTGTWRARLPTQPDRTRPARDFPPDQRAAAEAWLAARLARHPTALLPAEAPITARAWAEHWLNTFVRPIRAPTTTRRYWRDLRLLAPIYGMAVAAVRPSDLQAIVGGLVARMEPLTVLRAIGVWRRMFAAAIDDDLIARNPCIRLALPIAPPRGAGRHVTTAEVSALWPKIRGHRFEAAYALLLACGLRIGEVLGLHWEHVRLDEARVWVQHQWTEQEMRPLPKGRNPHWAHLPPRVVAALGRHRATQPADAVLVMQAPHQPRRRKGHPTDSSPRPWSYATVRSDLVAVCVAAGLTPFSPHATRHGLATALLDGGVSPAVVADRLGHTNPATTLTFYAKVSLSAVRHADTVVERYLGTEPSDQVTSQVCDVD
jgi:integrase